MDRSRSPFSEVSPAKISPSIFRGLVENVLGQRAQDGDGFVVLLLVDEDHAEGVLGFAEVGLEVDRPCVAYFSASSSRHSSVLRLQKVQVEQRDQVRASAFSSLSSTALSACSSAIRGSLRRSQRSGARSCSATLSPLGILRRACRCSRRRPQALASKRSRAQIARTSALVLPPGHARRRR